MSQNHHFLGASSSTNLMGEIVMPPTVTPGMFSFCARLRNSGEGYRDGGQASRRPTYAGEHAGATRTYS